MESISEDIPADDTIRLLIATDIHLGHQESDPVRSGDSFTALEEVVETAIRLEVDALLLAGDLFDVARPSPGTLLRATRILRGTLGSRPVALELLSDQQAAFGRSVNYEDADLNVSCPVFSIHGNHDDPVGQGAISSLDILSSMGLVNYFGRWSDYTQVSIAPVLLRKGSTQLALYGLGHLKDQRLSRLFKEGKVEILKSPSEEWFNLLVLHQNRADRGPGNFIHEEVLPDFLDMVVWGHEHDCRINEEQNMKRRFFVTQPGSTVATSLAAGEAIPKHCGLLEIYKKKFKLTPIPLKTVRPFIFKTIVLSEEDLGEATVNENEKVQEFLKQKVYEAVEEASSMRSDDPRQPKLPLVRLSVAFERDSQDFNRMRFGQQFEGIIANPADVLLMKREKRIRERAARFDPSEPMPQLPSAPDVEALLQAYFGALPDAKVPGLLSTAAMTDAVRSFTDKRDTDAFSAVVRATRARALEQLLASNAETEEEVAELLRGCRVAMDEADPAQRRILVKAAPPPTPVTEPVSEQVGRGARGGRAAGGGRGRGRGRGASVPQPEPSPERRSTPRRNAAKRNTSWLSIIADNKRGHDIDDSD